MISRAGGVIGFSLALLAAFGCGGSDDGGSTAPAISCSDGAAAGENTVTLNCGGALDGTSERVDVEISGPSTGVTTLRGLNFDVTYDPSKLEFVEAAAYGSPLFPGGLVIAVLANGQQGRVVIGIQQPGDLPPVEVAPGQHDVLSLTFRTVAGATFDPTPLLFDRAEATEASATISFTDGLALGYPQ